jgi:hypothetical protein
MTPVEIITTAREWANTPSTVASDSIALRYLNMRKDDLWSAFVSRADQDFNWEEWTSDTVASQTEYTIPTVSRTSYGAKAIHGVEVTYDGDTWYKAREVGTAGLVEPWAYYVANQDCEDPVFRVSDNSVFVAPAATTTQAGTGRLKMIGIRNIIDFTINGVDGASATTTEANMKFPLDRQKTLVFGLCADLCRFRSKFDDAARWEAQYTAEKAEYVSQASKRTATSFTANYPENGHYPVDPFANARI